MKRATPTMRKMPVKQPLTPAAAAKIRAKVAGMVTSK